MGGLLTQAWRSLEDRVRDEFAKSGHAAGDVSFTHMVRMQYYGQLVDIEVDAPKPAIEYDRGHPRADRAPSRRPTRGCTRGPPPRRSSATWSPRRSSRARSRSSSRPCRRCPRESGAPPVKETREVWWADGYATTDIYEMDDVRNGHTIEGPAVLEAESTTFPIPPDRRAWLDEHGIFHLENKEA